MDATTRTVVPLLVYRSNRDCSRRAQAVREIGAAAKSVSNGGLAEALDMQIDFAAWFSSKELSTAWTSRFFQIWAALLADRRDKPLEIVEIGSWEGRSALFLLNYFRNARLTCIDTFAGSAEHALRDKWKSALPFIEQRFDRNLAEFQGRFEKVKDNSSQALARLRSEGRSFDLAYVDGNHHSATVKSDADACWPMMRPHGVVIFDDYERNFFADTISHPKSGVDAFLREQLGTYRELLRSYQVIIERS